VKEYANAGHSFLNQHDKADLTLLTRVMLKLPRSAYHEPSARDARERIVSFFRTHLAA
jgi:carboxymethylenebutenolidase